jgi:hypothetical protein
MQVNDEWGHGGLKPFQNAGRRAAAILYINLSRVHGALGLLPITWMSLVRRNVTRAWRRMKRRPGKRN